jgi:hypothetical protein
MNFQPLNKFAVVICVSTLFSGPISKGLARSEDGPSAQPPAPAVPTSPRLTPPSTPTAPGGPNLTPPSGPNVIPPNNPNLTPPRNPNLTPPSNPNLTQPNNPNLLPNNNTGGGVGADGLVYPRGMTNNVNPNDRRNWVRGGTNGLDRNSGNGLTNGSAGTNGFYRSPGNNGIAPNVPQGTQPATTAPGINQ